MAASFEKLLTASDVNNKISVPSAFLRHVNGGDRGRMEVVDEVTGKAYQVILQTRAGKYRKRVITSFQIISNYVASYHTQRCAYNILYPTWKMLRYTLIGSHARCDAVSHTSEMPLYTPLRDYFHFNVLDFSL